jgi:restriction system protein
VEAPEFVGSAIKSTAETEEGNVETNEAFETLLSQLRQALKDAQDIGARAFRESRFNEAQAAGKRCEEVTAQIQHLENLQQRWSNLVHSAEPPEGKPKRLPRGQKTPRKEYWVPILIALEEAGGRGTVQEVLEQVEHRMKHRLKEVDWETLSDGRTIRWRNTAQWARSDMVKQGLLASDSPRGVWEINEAGRAYLQEHRAEAAAD